MNCYNHQNTPAVAICKNCSKGLCPECLTEVKNGIACTATCVDEVIAINALINNNKKAHGRVVGSYNRSAFVYFSLSVLFLLTGSMYPDLRFYMLSAGGIFLLVAILTYWSTKKMKNEQEM